MVITGSTQRWRCCAISRSSPPGLNLGMYNIWYSCGFGLPQVIRAVDLRNYDIMLLTGTIISDAVYFKNNIRHDNVCFRATPTVDEGAPGGVGLVTREVSDQWDV